MGVESIQWADGFVLVYSILDRFSFEYIQHCKTHIGEVRGVSTIGSVPIVLLANKADMVHLRQVTQEEGNQSRVVQFIIGVAPPPPPPPSWLFAAFIHPAVRSEQRHLLTNISSINNMTSVQEEKKKKRRA